jgi:hypothetical protein
MRGLWWVAVWGVTIMACPAAAQTPAADDLTSAVRLAVDRGEMLFLYDRVAWLGTDDFREQYRKLMDRAGGYVVTGDETQTELVFFDKSQARAVYRATFRLGKLVNSGPPAADRIGLSPLEKRLISAREKAMAAFMAEKVEPCAKANPNLAAVPQGPAGPIIVYLMTPQTDLKSYPLGGHYSVEVGQDGSVGKVRRFTNSCIDMKQSRVPKGGKPTTFWITHLLDPTPTEIHIFTSLASKLPIYVGTKNKLIWAVEGSRVRTVDQMK